MSIRVQVDGAGTAKTQLTEVAKGVYGIAAAEGAAEKAAAKRVAAQGKAPTFRQQAGALSKVTGGVGALAGGAISSMAVLGPFGAAIAAVTAGLNAAVAINDRYVASVIAVNERVRSFSQTLSERVGDYGESALARLESKSPSEKARIKRHGGPKAQALIQAELIKKQTEEAEDAFLMAGVGRRRAGLAARRAPGSELVAENYRRDQANLENLNDANKAQNFLGRAKANVFSQEGSQNVQFIRAAEIMERAGNKMAEGADNFNAGVSRSGGAGY